MSRDAPLEPSPGPQAGLNPLGGLRIVVCRPRRQARSLAEGLTAAGAVVLSAPVIAIVDPDDRGAALRTALGRLRAGDWLVVTSPNGATAAMSAGPVPAGVGVATVGPGTARRARSLGLEVDLVPERSVAEGLLEEFPAPGPDGGLVVLARAARARAVLPDGLRAAGWEVLDVAAYRNVAAKLTHEQRRAAAAADGVVFTSSSTVERLVAELGADSVPPLVASIGPATSATAAALGVEVTVEAAEHTIEGVVAALVRHAGSWIA